MFSNLGMLTAVVFLSFLVSLVLSLGILAVVLKTMSFRTTDFASTKAADAVKPRTPGRIQPPENAVEMAWQTDWEDRVHGRRH
jgi:hypothetical protein